MFDRAPHLTRGVGQKFFIRDRHCPKANDWMEGKRPMTESSDHDDEESLMAYLEVTAAPDPGDLAEDEPELQPLCAECVRELPDGDDGLCAFCRVVMMP